MKIITNFNPSSASSGTFNVAFPGNRGKMLVYNESNVNVQLTFSNNYTTYVPAWTAMLYCLSDLPTPLVTWSVYSTLTSSGAPISQVVIETFDHNEAVPGTYPAPLVRQTNIGNTINTVATGSSFLLNNGQPPGTNIITATPSDAGSATWNADNSGNLTIKSDNAGTLTTLLQLVAGASPAVKLAAVAVLTEALGALKVDGTFESVGAATLDSTLAVTGTSAFTGDVTFNGAGNGITVTNNALVSGTLTATGGATFNGAGNGITVANNLAVNGTTSLDNGAITTDGSGNITKWAGLLQVSGTVPALSVGGNKTRIQAPSSGSINLQVPGATDILVATSSSVTTNVGLTFVNSGIAWKTGDTISGTHTFTGTTTGTFTHGAGGTPFIVIPMCSVNGSQTMGYDSITSTQVHITSAAGLGFKALCILG